MTFEPTKLDSLGASLEAEARSVEILRRRLDALVSRAGEDAERGGPGGVKRAEEVLDAYSAWLSDTSKGFGVGGLEVVKAEREVQDIIDEVLFRQRYISNQLTLLSLSQNRKPKESRITKLQRYNEVKDAAQELMGLVAENRGVTVRKLYEDGEFGVSAED